MNVNYTLPFWTIVIFIVPAIIGIIWTLIKMFFHQKDTYTRIKIMESLQSAQEKSLLNLEKDHQDKVDTLKKDLESKLDRQKIATDGKLTEINNIMIETRTMVKLLVEDKIKK